MSGLSSPSLGLDNLFNNAGDAERRLLEHMGELRHSADRPPLVESGETVELEEKYRTVNRYIQFGDEAARWINSQTALAVECQVKADAIGLIQRVRQALARTIQPAPSWELVERDL